MKSVLTKFIRQNYQLFTQLPGYVGVYDKDSHVAYCNEAHALAMGFINGLSAFGKTYDQVCSPSCELAESFKARDQQIMTHLDEVSYLSYTKTQSGQSRLYFGTKKPIFDVQNNPIGILSLSHDITHKRLIDISRFVSNSEGSSLKKTQFTYTVTDQINCGAVKLSKRQLECLYYLIRGRSLKEIAQLLGLSHRTVETYINYIKTKWQCQSIRELVQKGIHLGCMNIIPESIFKQAKIIS